MPFDTGYILNQRYRIVSLLGQGGMGAVYRAWDLNLKKPVAIKENLDSSPAAQKQFIHEAQILSRLSHPNLPRVTDYFSIPDKGQYLVMDFIEGEDLQSMIERLSVIPEPDALKWTTQVCEALSYLHHQTPPIIHRDIKPANIKINPEGNAVLVDFGIAKVFDSTLMTTAGAKAVTPGFSPPEQYGSAPTDARSDIYALGATLYYLLTGQVPPESVHRVTGTESMPEPRFFNPGINPAVNDAIMRAMQVSSDQRFQNIDAFQSILQAQLQAEEEQYQPTQYINPASVQANAQIRAAAVPPSAPPISPPDTQPKKKSPFLISALLRL